MRFRDADSAAREYLRLLARLGSPVSQRLTVTAGAKPANFCPGCKSIESFVGRDKNRGTDLLRCQRCGRPWPIVLAEVPRQRIDGARHRAIEDCHVDFATLGTLLGMLPIWERRLLLLVAPGNLSLARVEGECRKLWPWRSHPWSQYRIRADLHSARARLEKILGRRGLLAQ